MADPRSGSARDPKQPSIAWTLAAAGFLPFAVCAMALAFWPAEHPLHVFVADAFRLYGAVILSFLGGIRWGMAINDMQDRRLTLAISVLPAILGWLAMFLPPGPGIALLLFGFCAQGAWDSLAFHGRPGLAWFASLRIALTLLVAAAHLIALFSLG